MSTDFTEKRDKKSIVSTNSLHGFRGATNPHTGPKCVCHKSNRLSSAPQSCHNQYPPVVLLFNKERQIMVFFGNTDFGDDQCTFESKPNTPKRHMHKNGVKWMQTVTECFGHCCSQKTRKSSNTSASLASAQHSIVVNKNSVNLEDFKSDTDFCEKKTGLNACAYHRHESGLE